MTRRALFAILTGAALDPEKLLWRPGVKLISIPKAAFPWPYYLSLEEFDRCYMRPAWARIQAHWEKLEEERCRDLQFYSGVIINETLTRQEALNRYPGARLPAA
jgi:hypothetical protein